jgi:hypothetical protein
MQTQRPPPTIDDVAQLIGRHSDDILACYVWGSRLYRCACDDSDWDIVCVLCVSAGAFADVVLDDGWLNVALYSHASWVAIVEQSFCWAIMLIGLPPEHECCLRYSQSLSSTHQLVIPLVRKVRFALEFASFSPYNDIRLTFCARRA